VSGGRLGGRGGRRIDAGPTLGRADRRRQLSRLHPPDHMRSIIAWPNPEHDTCVAPCISRAKS
jgi:hypothetical protein